LIPLIALLVGWAIGFFDSNMRTSKKIKQAEESAQAAIRAAESRMADTQAKLAFTATSQSAHDDPGLMRIKSESGFLTLDLDGVRVNPSALTAEQRKRLVEMLNAMRPWLEGKPASPPAPSSVPAPERPAPTPIAPPPPVPIVQPQATTSKPAPTTKKKDDKPEPVPTSIVGQVNLILQERIVNTPLEAKGVSLMESATGGVNVFVGLQRYEAIDDIPDDEIKAAIRAAIAEWENKYTPGLK
jgi:predicted component of type VI protein secretion system